MVFLEMRELKPPVMDGGALDTLRSWPLIHDQEIPSLGFWGGSGLWEILTFPEREGSYRIKLPFRAPPYCEAGEQRCKETLLPEREENTSSSSGPTTNSQDERQEEAGPAETSSPGDRLSFCKTRQDLRCVSPLAFPSGLAGQGSRNIPGCSIWLATIVSVSTCGVPSSPNPILVHWLMFCPEMEQREAFPKAAGSIF